MSTDTGPRLTVQRRSEDAHMDEFRVYLLLAGDTGVGKSTLVQRLIAPLADFDDEYQARKIASTIGVEFQSLELELTHEGAHVHLFFIDVPGNTRYAPYLPTYYRMAHGVIFMYDVTCRYSWESLAIRWREERDRHGPQLMDQTALLLANKADRPVGEHMVTEAEGRALAGVLGVAPDNFSVASATEWSRRHLLTPVEQMIVRIVRQLRLARRSQSQLQNTTTTTTTNTHAHTNTDINANINTPSTSRSNATCCS